MPPTEYKENWASVECIFSVKTRELGITEKNKKSKSHSSYKLKINWNMKFGRARNYLMTK